MFYTLSQIGLNFYPANLVNDRKFYDWQSASRMRFEFDFMKAKQLDNMNKVVHVNIG